MMTETSCLLCLQPEGRTCTVPAGTTVEEALHRLGARLVAPCGGEGTCGKCRVQAAGELTSPTPSERALLSSEELENGVRLACQARLNGRVEVSVPAGSLAPEMRILLDGTIRQVPLEPSTSKKVVRQTPQTLSEPYARLEHLRRCGDLRADVRADLDLLRRLPAVLDTAGDTVTVTLWEDLLLDVEPGERADRCFGVALDLGTTTVVASLVDLASGREVAHAATVNQQTRFGHDVVSRINATLEREDGLAEVQEAARASLDRVIAEVLERSGVQRREVCEATLVGNATMMHLALGIAPGSLGRMPYVATVGDPVVILAAELGLELHPAARLYVLPNIAGFVGADTVAAILAAHLDEDDGRIRLLADIGTNCELALRLGDRLLVTSTPAGPAFEGARIACGMYAAPGAIEKVRIDGQVTCRTIGGQPPRGLCGSGLVDASAELLRTGLVDVTGRLLPPDELDNGLEPALRERLLEGDGGVSFLLARAESGDPVVITQRDLRELQLAKAAIRSGIDLLLEHAGVELPALDELCLAGGFGNYIDKENAMRLGLIPELPLEKLNFIGNGALVGARLTLLSRSLRRKGHQVARQAEHLQLAHTPDFQMRFSEAMLFT
jgi:uncharacterized 2Fe-2S/4Fe-4S cluster protein (DUF4445 family)